MARLQNRAVYLHATLRIHYYENARQVFFKQLYQILLVQSYEQAVILVISPNRYYNCNNNTYNIRSWASIKPLQRRQKAGANKI
jgi:hypothetical protein